MTLAFFTALAAGSSRAAIRLRVRGTRHPARAYPVDGGALQQGAVLVSSIEYDRPPTAEGLETIVRAMLPASRVSPGRSLAAGWGG